MKKTVVLVLILAGLSAAAFSQKPYKVTARQAVAFTVKKQEFIDQIESGVNSVPYAAARVYIRYRLAQWLWIPGKDTTGRAEPITVKAIDEAYDKANEIPSEGPDLNGLLFNLLDNNAKETSARLKAKYKFSDDNLIKDAFFNLQKPGGDKLVGEKILRSIALGGELDAGISFVLSDLRKMKSPQFLLVLTAILDRVESGQIAADPWSLSMFSDDFADPLAPLALKRRYFNLVLATGRKALLEPGESQYPNALRSPIDDLGASLPDLVPEAEAIEKALTEKSSAVIRSLIEAKARIEASTDKIAANVDEAEKADDMNLKGLFYSQAISLAVQAEKYELAIGLIETLRGILKKENADIVRDFTLMTISRKALEKDEIALSARAVRDIRNNIKQAEAWTAAAIHFASKNDTLEAQDALGKAIKILSDAPKEDPKRVLGLIQLVRDVKKADKTRLPEIVTLTAKAINDFPAPGADDKPGTKNYEKYVIFIGDVESYLASAMWVLLRENKADAADLAERIQKREIRVLADLWVGIDALETAQREALRKGAK